MRNPSLPILAALRPDPRNVSLLCGVAEGETGTFFNLSVKLPEKPWVDLTLARVFLGDYAFPAQGKKERKKEGRNCARTRKGRHHFHLFSMSLGLMKAMTALMDGGRGQALLYTLALTHTITAARIMIEHPSPEGLWITSPEHLITEIIHGPECLEEWIAEIHPPIVAQRKSLCEGSALFVFIYLSSA
ncbi:hypothetical protein AVEN_86363-1 [Araneus ventricosus]|uniref:Uncharacterized protein n=1 Tax=Araneus ventricosus TaxID=182803 RepID=A0A4Y1ZLD6_ARAVE|nr:hypothetical protein AVEN_50992-1 [Araneus ventricosus]GBL56569.1 hypothetical protein AVEN_86363-1 [Araneus ventricosus]